MLKLIKVAVAAAAGFAAGILVAPKSGKETRQDIKKKAKQAKSAAKEGSRTVKKSADAASKEVAAFGRSARASADKTPSARSCARCSRSSSPRQSRPSRQGKTIRLSFMPFVRHRLTTSIWQASRHKWVSACSS